MIEFFRDPWHFLALVVGVIAFAFVIAILSTGPDDQ